MKHICIKHGARFTCDGDCGLAESVIGPCCGSLDAHAVKVADVPAKPKRVRVKKDTVPEYQAPSGNLFAA